jgi:hypothetical protein
MSDPTPYNTDEVLFVSYFLFCMGGGQVHVQRDWGQYHS